MLYQPLGRTSNPNIVKHNVHVTLRIATQPFYAAFCSNGVEKAHKRKNEERNVRN